MDSRPTPPHTQVVQALLRVQITTSTASEYWKHYYHRPLQVCL